MCEGVFQASLCPSSPLRDRLLAESSNPEIKYSEPRTKVAKKALISLWVDWQIWGVNPTG